MVARFFLHFSHLWIKWDVVTFILILILFSPYITYAQDDGSEYDEISVFLSVPRIGGAEVTALLKNEDLYLSITDVFNFLRIKNDLSPGFNSVKGFFINQDAEYFIDREKGTIIYKKERFEIKPGDILRTETNLYLKMRYFRDVFGLDISFNFRNLAASLNTKIELPVIREMRQEQMRKSISQLKGNVIADTIIKRRYPLLHFGNADWTVISQQEVKGSSSTKLALDLGAVIAGGETKFQLNYDSNSPFYIKNQFYQWRYVNNDYKALKQVTLGKISSNTISTISSPVIGGEISNVPTSYRRSFGSYVVSDMTEPGWLVELYVNNVLVDYKQADASGFYTFEVPLVYGSTDIKLQFYGPWGEERSKEKNIEIPFNFLPAGNVEYRISGGMVDDSLHSIFSKANLDIGISRFLTVGGGIEYLSSLDSNSYIPYAKASLKLAQNILLTGEYNHGVNYKAVFNWRLKSDLQFEANFTKYAVEQKAINTNYTEERKLSVSMPVRLPKFTFFTRLSLNQYITSLTEYTSGELLFSGGYRSFNMNLTTNAQLYQGKDPYIYSNLSLSMRLPGGFIFTPQVLYNYKDMNFTSARFGVEKKLLKKGYLTLSYDKNFNTKSRSAEIGFRYDFSFAQVGMTAQRNGGKYSFTESANGSLIVDTKSAYISGSSRSTVGNGGLLLQPFLDINCNGSKDRGEPKVYGIQAHISGGRIEQNDKDTTIRVFDLEPYARHIINVNADGMDNIAWQLKNHTFDIVVEPNMFRRIDIPVSVMGEASGMVYLSGRNGKSGQGRIIINFHRVDSSLVKSTLSEADGYFSFLGLKPGKYYAQIDPAQMEKVGMTASEPINFEIHSLIDGDIVDNLEFTLKKNIEDEEVVPANDTVKTSEIIMPAQQKNVVKDTLQKSEESGNNFRVQLLATKTRIEKDGVFEYIISAMPGIKIEEIKGKDGFYRYSTSGYKSKAEAETVMKEIRKNGWKDCFITSDNNREAKAMKGSFEGYKYKIQLLATIKPVEIREVFGTLLNTIKNLQIVENLESDGLYHYSAGMFRSKKAASDFVKLLNDSGWKECYILHL